MSIFEFQIDTQTGYVSSAPAIQMSDLYTKLDRRCISFTRTVLEC